MIDIDDLLGLPYLEHGRDENGYDCYGLVIEVEKRFGYEIPDYQYEYNGNNSYEIITSHLGMIKECGLIRSREVEEGDLILFENKNGQGTHIAVYLGNDKYIHCVNRGVSIGHLSKSMLNWEGFKWQK